MFQPLGKQICIKYDLINDQQLQYLSEHGCRVLIIKQTVFQNNGNLLLENSNGSLRRMSPDELEKRIRPKDGKLKIDAVFLNMKNGK